MFGKNLSAQTPLVRKNSLTFSEKLPPLSSIVAYTFIFFLFYAFISGITLKFYASAVFFFYSFINRMWISVICLGIFQTILLIPFRIVKLLKANHLKEFVENIEEMENAKQQQYTFRMHVKKGTRTILFYSVDFFVQLVSYASIGRLFLTDFYNKPLNPDLLYSFVRYPQYPIQDRFFKIPYPHFTNTVDFGFHIVLIALLVIFCLMLLLRFIKYLSQHSKTQDEAHKEKMRMIYAKFSGQLLLFSLIAWFLIRHFPVDWKIAIFSGDVALQNTKFNTITAIVTFLTLLWFGVNNIYNKSKIAKAEGIDDKVIDKTELELFKNTLQNSALIGLAAFFITNQIPSAFELSIFTLEIISLISPLTLDKLIMNLKIKEAEKTAVVVEKAN